MLVDTVPVRADSPDGRPLFVGIGSERDVDGYLAGVAHAERSDGDLVSTGCESGWVSVCRGPPSEEDFWVASAESCSVTVTWKVEEGRWGGMVMNADAERGVVADVRLGARLRWLGEAAATIPAAGAALLVSGAAAIW